MNTITRKLDSKVEKIQLNHGQKPVYRFIASTQDPDRLDDIIDVSGWDTKNWEQNPVILWSHNRSALPIGRGVRVQKDATIPALMIDIEFTDKEVNPMGEAVAKLIDAGYLKAVSVGFRPIEFEARTDNPDFADMWFPPLHFKKQELLELSVVNVPANPSALQVLNSIERESLYSEGIVPGKVHQVIARTLESGNTWCKEHDFSTAKTSGKDSAIIFEQLPVSEFEEGSFKTVSINDDIKMIVGTPKKVPHFNNDKVWKDALAAMSSNSGAGSYIESINDLRKTIDRFSTVTEKLATVATSLASLAEISNSDKSEPPAKSVTPDASKKQSDRLSEQMYKQLADQLEETRKKCFSV